MPIKSSSVIEVNDTKWSDIILSSYAYDFYHTQSYHQLEINNRPVLFVANFEKDFIAIPLIIRNIEGTPYFDCTSVYGYCGPISNIDFESSFKLAILTLMNTVNSSAYGLSDFNFIDLHFITKYFLIFFMIIGRVELLSLLLIAKKFLFKY